MGDLSLATERCGSQETARKYTRYERPGLVTLQLCETEEGLRWLAPLPPSVAILFDFLWLEADEKGRVRISQRDLAEIFRVSRRTIRRRLRRLEAAGLIRRYTRTGARGSTVIYVKWRPLGFEVFGRSFPQAFSTSDFENAEQERKNELSTQWGTRQMRRKSPTGTGQVEFSTEKWGNKRSSLKLKKEHTTCDENRGFSSSASEWIAKFRSALQEFLPPDKCEEFVGESLSARQFLRTLVDAFAKIVVKSAPPADPQRFAAMIAAELGAREIPFDDQRDVHSWMGWVAKKKFEAMQP